MKYSTRLSNGVHILVFISEHEKENLTSGDIAESIKTNPSYVRKLMGDLKNSGLIISEQGKAEPRLGRDPSEINLLHVYRAVEGNKPLIHINTGTNPECGVGVHIQYALEDFYEKIQRDAEKSMESITLEDIILDYRERIKSVSE